MGNRSLYLAALLSMASGCYSGECLIPCSSTLTVEALLEDFGGSVHVAVCDGTRYCESGVVSHESGGYLDPSGYDFEFSWYDSTLSVERSDTLTSSMLPENPSVSLVVTAVGGSTLVDDAGVPEVTYEVHCGGFDCPQRRITF